MTLKPYARVRRGTDSSGRPVLLNARMDAALKEVEADLRSKGLPAPIITQGAYMAELGGGASASAGYHDAGGALDFRTWHLTDDQKQAQAKAFRRHGWAYWQRGPGVKHGGMDEHGHAVLLGDKEAAPGLKGQEAEYRAGGDGLTGGRPDYHWRPKTITEFNYPAYVKRLRKPTVTMREFKRRHLTRSHAAAVKAGNPNAARRLKRWLDAIPGKGKK